MRVLAPYLLVLTSIMANACGDQAPPPLDSNRPQSWWIIIASSQYNGLSGNGGGIGSSTTAWSNALKEGTDYSIAIDSRTNPVVDLGLDCDNDLTFRDFLLEFISSEQINQNYKPANNSFLFGVNTPLHDSTPLGNILGQSYFQGAFTLLQGGGPAYACSFVFKTKIYNDQTLTTPEQKWRGIAYCVEHELGHSRGLMGNLSRDYDHTYHDGSNKDICVMHAFDQELAIADHHFCGKHKKILHDCCSVISPGYGPNLQCALGPYQ